MNENITALLRGTRTFLQIIAEPLDLATRLLNNKMRYPPLWLRQNVGDPSYFEGSCGEYVTYLKLLCGLKPGDNLLDIGCGCGLILMDVTGTGSLVNYLGPNGRYAGVDIDRRAISWCQKCIGSRYPTCKFYQVDGHTFPLYNYRFDVILAKSLFTHLLPSETENYLRLVRDYLKPGGRCLSTWFLLRGQELKGKYTFKWLSWPEAYERVTRPKLAVAYHEDWLLKKMKEVGLEVELPIRYGTWSGRQDGLSFQDIIIMGREV